MGWPSGGVLAEVAEYALGFVVPDCGLEGLAMDVSDSSGAGSAVTVRKLVAALVCEVSAPAASTFEYPLEGDHPVAGHLGRVEAEVARHGGMVVETVGDMLGGRLRRPTNP
jgi:class 3 adenylate cyclase